MASIYFHNDGSPTLAVKEENDIKFHRGDFDVIKSNGKIKTVSDDDYHSFIANEKTVNLDGDNVVFADPLKGSPDDIENISSDDFDKIKNYHLEMVSKILETKGSRLNEAAFADLKARLEAFKTGLENVDKSSISFPLNVSFIRYWLDNESSAPFHGNFIAN